MIIDVIMPKMGESITEGTVLEWYKTVGESIEKDETLLEIGTDKVDSEIPSPASGVIEEILAEPNDVIDVGKVIARINSDGSSDKKDTTSSDDFDLGINNKVVEKIPPPNDAIVKKEVSSVNISVKDNKSAMFTPVVLKIANQEGIPLVELGNIQGKGANGRITKKDIQSYISSRSSNQTIEKNIESTTAKDIETKIDAGQNNNVEQIGHMRKLIAEHMRHSLDTSAHVYIMNEVDMTRVVNFIKENEQYFYEKENFKLTVTPFIISATSNALRETPEMNASINGDSIIYHKNINMGIAVSVDSGLMVPSIFNCDEKNFIGISRELNSIASQTRTKTISPDALQGSTFTISNFGVFGATIGTPIINQPNVGILGTGTIKKQPVIVEKNQADIIAIRSIMMLSLGFDHRLIDGAGGAKFISRIKQNLENLNLENLI